MAAFLESILNSNLSDKLRSSKVLVVGAGGIGCELLKNLVLTGFSYIEVIDLDTIDVSNLNRQFLFRKEHVGKSKAQVARASALQFNPNVTIIAYHDSIMNANYGVQYFQKFDIVMNALDNQAARNHVNRMCLAADVPLVESGTAGYLGQVTVIKKSLTECYECQPKPAQKTYPGCTIRNTPSEPVHCIVWAKHLFNQLFGEADPDQDVSPDTEDPEAAGDAGRMALQSDASEAVGGVERKSTRAWAEETGYNPEKLFNKFFNDDIAYLLSMKNLWKKRRAPTPLNLSSIPESDGVTDKSLMRDQRVWSVKECASVFCQSIDELQQRLKNTAGNSNDEGSSDSGMLVWDKDDEPAMNFVASASNLRAYAFGILLKSKFDIKSMAGNIIPAIATTNAIIAGLIVMEGLKILGGQISKCTSVYLNRQPNPRKKLLVPCALDPPNPKCYVCASKPEVALRLNVTTFSVKQLEEKVLKSGLGMVAPDVEIDDGKGTILISSEEGETEDALSSCKKADIVEVRSRKFNSTSCNMLSVNKMEKVDIRVQTNTLENGRRMLSEFGINTGTRLKCDDFLQEFNIVVSVFNIEKLPDEQEFELVGDLSKVQPDENNIPAPCASANEQASTEPEDDDDLLMVSDEEVDVLEADTVVGRKRKADEAIDNEGIIVNADSPTHKKLCVSSDS